MNSDYVRMAKALWNLIGKDAAANFSIKNADKYIHRLCQKYNMSEDNELSIVQSLSDLAEYTIRAKLNGDNVDSTIVLNHIKGPIAQSLMIGVSSVNDSDNLIAELFEEVDESDLDKMEQFFTSIGITDTSKYFSAFKDVLSQIKEGTITDSNKLMEKLEEIPYALEEIPYAEEFEEGDGKVQIPIKETKGLSVSENMTESDEEQFVQDLPKRFIGKKISTPEAAIELINTFTKATEDVIRFTEIQKSRRAEIQAEAKVRIAEIDAMKDVIMTYLNKTFDERSKIFAKQFECVDKALAEGDVNFLAVSLNSITELAKSSPFKALTDINVVQKQLSNKNTVFDI